MAENLLEKKSDGAPPEELLVNELQRQRRSSTHDERQVLALEMIADQLCLIAHRLSGESRALRNDASKAKARGLDES